MEEGGPAAVPARSVMPLGPNDLLMDGSTWGLAGRAVKTGNLIF